MVEIKKLKIKKQLYKFEIRKRFQYAHNYKIKEIPPGEKIIRAISAAFKKPKKESVKASNKLEVPKRNNFVLYISIFLAFLVLVVGGLYVFMQSVKPESKFMTRAPGNPELNFELIDSGVLTSGPKTDAPPSVGFLRFVYSNKLINQMNVSLWTYPDNVPSEVFILKSRMYDSETKSYPDFKNALKKDLWAKKVSVNEIDLEQTETLQKGSILVVPSAYLPQELLGIGSNFDIKQLMDRGIVVLYIGYPFDSMINSENQITSVPKSTAEKLKFTFEDKGNMYTTLPNLEDPYYSVTYDDANYKNFLLYGSVSVVKKGDGAILFVPQSLDLGWGKNGVLAAEDVEKIILESLWINPDSSQPVIYTFNSSVENATVSEFFTSQFNGNQRYVKVLINGIDVNSEPISEQRVVQIKKEARGFLYIQGGPTVVPSALSGSDVKFIADLREPLVGSKILYLAFIQDGVQVGDRLLANSKPVSLQVESQFVLPLTLDSGSYIVDTVDDDNKIYAEAYMRVVFVDVKRLPDKKEREVFVFSFTKEGIPTVLDTVEVTVESKDGQKFGTYTFNKVSQAEVDVSKNVVGDVKLPYGSYVFKFKIGGVVKTVNVNLVAPENIFLSLPFLVVGGVAILIIAVGTFLARNEGVVYGLDIPDFPPISRTKIPIKSDVVLSVFDRVNDDYKWKFTPLTVSEIKNGFKKIFFEGRPIYISDYNVEFIMDKLVRKKQVFGFMDYYAPLKWESETNHSIRYLSMFRKLRDIFVNNVVPFTMLEEEKSCDTKISLMGQEMFVHIYDKRRDLKAFAANILTSSNHGLTFVVFKDKTEKNDFKDLLASATPVAAALKLEVETNAVQLMDMEELEAMINEMKAV